MTDRELWSAQQVAAEYGWSAGYARRWLSEHGVRHVRTTGVRDTTRLYDPEQVRAAHDRMPGRGYRTDLHQRTIPPQQQEQTVNDTHTQITDDVTDLVHATFDSELADAIVEDEAFGALVGTLTRDTGGDYDSMDRLLTGVSNSLEDRTLNWLIERADHPAAYIASRI